MVSAPSEKCRHISDNPPSSGPAEDLAPGTGTLLIRPAMGLATSLAVAGAIAYDGDNAEVVVDWKSDVDPDERDMRFHAGQLEDYLHATGAARGMLVYMTPGVVRWVGAFGSDPEQDLRLDRIATVVPAASVGVKCRVNLPSASCVGFVGITGLYRSWHREPCPRRTHYAIRSGIRWRWAPPHLIR
jgi:hypothetical protein